MSSAEPERSYVPVADPADRPRTTRETVRVIMIDHDRALLFADSDPGAPEAHWWVTPGGQIEPGESMAEAAVREMWELVDAERRALVAEHGWRGRLRAWWNPASLEVLRILRTSARRALSGPAPQG